MPESSKPAVPCTKDATDPKRPPDGTTLLRYLAEAPTLTERLVMSAKDAEEQGKRASAAIDEERKRTLKYLQDWQASWDMATKGKGSE